jgi:hypothetical protein
MLARCGYANAVDFTSSSPARSAASISFLHSAIKTYRLCVKLGLCILHPLPGPVYDRPPMRDVRKMSRASRRPEGARVESDR